MENFTFSLNTSSGLVAWSPPSFYSHDIPHGSTTIYYVYVVNQNGSVITDVNTTDTFYQLFSNLTECDIYSASVTAFIEQYSSLVTNATEENTGGKIVLLLFLINILSDYTIEILNHTVKFNISGNSSIIQVQFTINVRINYINIC